MGHLDARQRAARERALAALRFVLGAVQAGSDLSAVDLAPFVDAVIEAATPGLSEHADAVSTLRLERP